MTIHFLLSLWLFKGEKFDNNIFFIEQSFAYKFLRVTNPDPWYQIQLLILHCATFSLSLIQNTKQIILQYTLILCSNIQLISGSLNLNFKLKLTYYIISFVYQVHHIFPVYASQYVINITLKEKRA